MTKTIPPALETKNLTFRYGKRVALDEVTLSLPQGRLYGLLGRNGAGKTTLLNLVSAAVPASGDSLRVFGKRPFENQKALSKVCFVRERNMYPRGARVSDILFAASLAYPRWDGEYAKKLVKAFELDMKKRFKQLSRGMESSLGLVIGMASRAPLTMFDEPSLGLDAPAREFLIDEIARDMREHPRTMVLSTHLIDEGARLFDEVVMIDKGRVLLQEDKQTLLDSCFNVLGAPENVERATRGLRTIHAGVTDDGRAFKTVRADADFHPEGVELAKTPLQKLFVYLTEGGEAQ